MRHDLNMLILRDYNSLLIKYFMLLSELGLK